MSVNSVKNDGSLLRVAGGTLYADAPIGEIHAFGGSVVPSGYLLCDGKAVSRTSYKELFAVIGTTFGTGDGSTTFNVPDLCETVPVGVGTRDIGVADHDTYTLGQFKDDQLQEHGHTIIFQDNANINGGGRARALRNETPYNSSSNTLVTDVQNARTGTTTHGKQLGVNYIIKAKQVAVPFDIAEYIRNQNVLSEYENVTLSQNVEYTALYDGILIMGTPNAGELTVNSIRVGYVTEGWGSGNFTVVVKKGDKVKYTGTSYLFAKIAYYKLRDYSDRN